MGKIDAYSLKIKMMASNLHYLVTNRCTNALNQIEQIREKIWVIFKFLLQIDWPTVKILQRTFALLKALKINSFNLKKNQMVKFSEVQMCKSPLKNFHMVSTFKKPIMHQAETFNQIISIWNLSILGTNSWWWIYHNFQKSRHE